MSVFENSMCLQLFPSGEVHLQKPSKSPFLCAAPVICKEQHKTELNPFLNCTENGDIDGTYIRSCKFISTSIFSFPAN